MQYLHDHPYGHLIKYFLAGGVVVAVNLAVLYTLTDIFGIFYLYSTVLSNLVAFCVSFVLQKYWTFRDHSRENAHKQFAVYLLLQIANVSTNAGLMYVFVTYLHIWYILSQVIIGFLLALVVFVINKLFIFTPTY